MATKFEFRMLSCKECPNSKLIKCLAHRDYSEWICRSCSIKKKWASKEYRDNRPKKKPPTRMKFGSEEHKAHMSKVLTGRTLTEEHKSAISESSKIKWLNDEFRQKIAATKATEDSKCKRSEISRKLWNDEQYRAKYSTEEYRAKMRAVTTALWANPNYRNKVISAKSTPEHKALMQAIQKDPEYIRKLSLACNKLPRVSSLQKTLYSMLDDLGITYIGEDKDHAGCVIGPWSFDCVIPLPHKTLLIECQGDWVHSLPHKIIADKAKATYVTKYLHSSHSLKYLWEHQFSTNGQVLALLKNWCGILNDEIIDYSFGDVTIRRCTPDEYKLFLQAYHYLANAGRGGIVYGAYIKDKLIAICAFSPLPRQNVTVCDIDSKYVKDLSRFCIHPNYRKKNFGSWFISRAIAALPKDIKAIISYADKTFNHDGAMYKATNFKLDSIVKADYWYASEDGWVMHKKTLYNKASNLKLTESEYASKYGFVKIHGLEKSRFVFIR